VYKNLLGQRQLYQFVPNGPVFTGEHQFVMNLEDETVGVRDKHALIWENPHLEAETNNIHELNSINYLLQYKYGHILKVSC